MQESKHVTENVSKTTANSATLHWFRHGLRLHDNPALLEALQPGKEFYPIFIFDGEVAGNYNSTMFSTIIPFLCYLLYILTSDL